MPKCYNSGNIDNIYDSNLKKSIDKNFKNNTIKSKKQSKYRNCDGYEKIPHILPKKKRIIAIGDIHGDYDLAINCFKLANLIDDKLNWIASPPDTVVVQVGDQIDRCRPIIGKSCNHPDTTLNDDGRDIDVLNLFNLLHQKASKKGGAVISLLGNHEIMNVQGMMTYVSHEGLKQFDDYINPETGKKFESGLEARKYLFSRGNKYSQLLACTRQTAIIIGSNLFVHAAILPKLSKDYNVKNINLLVKKWLLKQISTDKKVKGIGTVRDILNNINVSPFWPRILGSLPPGLDIENDECINYMQETLFLYKCNNMIIGHTPQFYSNKSGISSTCSGINKLNNKNMGVWRIDTGSSKAFDSFSEDNLESRKPSVLEIIDDSTFNILI